MAVTAREATSQARRLLELRESLRHRLRDKARALALIDALFVNPYISVARAAELLQVSNPTARQAVGLLLEQGLLEEITGRDWGRLYLARPILEAIDPASQPD